MSDYTERLEDLRERAHRIYEAAKDDPEVPPTRVAELQQALHLIETGWRTVGTHDNPEELAERIGMDLDAKLEEWEGNFDERERELGLR